MNSARFVQEYFAVGDNKLYCKYHRHGLPTVIFEAGMGDGSDSWSYVQREVSGTTSTFSYDRAGVARSEVLRTPRTGWDIVQDLKNLLSQAAITPPYLLVGHSFGGLLVRLFASMYANDVVGMVLLDAAPEYKELSFQRALSNELRLKMKDYLQIPKLNSECIDKMATYQQICRNRREFDFPITIVMRGVARCYGDGWPEKELLEIEQELQFKYRVLSSQPKIVTAKESGHYIHRDEPELVIGEIMQIIQNHPI